MAGQWSALIRRLLCGQTFQSDLIYLFPKRFFYPHPNEYEISLKSASIVSYEYIYEAAAREKLARSMQAINSFYTRGQQTVSHHKMERTRKDEQFHWRRLNIIFAFQLRLYAALSHDTEQWMSRYLRVLQLDAISGFSLVSFIFFLLSPGFVLYLEIPCWLFLCSCSHLKLFLVLWRPVSCYCTKYDLPLKPCVCFLDRGLIFIVIRLMLSKHFAHLNSFWYLF